MDKVIIDGVDVKDCKRRIGKNSYCRYFKRPCADNNFNCIWKQLKRFQAELQRYKDMAKKGLEEFKDVGGCWGCGIQESLNQAWADCKTYRQALQEIREICKNSHTSASEDYYRTADKIQDKINEVIGVE